MEIETEKSVELTLGYIEAKQDMLKALMHETMNIDCTKSIDYRTGALDIINKISDAIGSLRCEGC